MRFDHVRKYGRNIRVHGNGFVQIDLLDRPGSRVHVFGHPDVPRQSAPTPIHDHRFGFESNILSGCLINVDWEFTTAGPKDRHTHLLCGYVPGLGEDTKLIPTGETGTLWALDTRVRVAGQSYTVERGRLERYSELPSRNPSGFASTAS